jgi:hypothetical protein
LRDEGHLNFLRVGPRVRGGRRALVGLGAAALLAATGAPTVAWAQNLPIKERNIGVSRSGATEQPRSEGDQALADGWVLYRTERGQTAFNDSMATLKATDSKAPSAAAFNGCTDLQCGLSLPALSADGWIPPGRIWVSPTEYILIVHSPRLPAGQQYRRRAARDMRYFVLHEFHNSTRNTDPFDTISSHSGSVFVPLYMSKQWTDAKGRRFVIVVQIAPHDVFCFHATDKGSAGPGMEVAKNYTDELEPLQALAGIVIASIIKAAAPQLEVVNHGGTEGLPMLKAYQHRIETLRGRPGAAPVVLPFVPATPQRIASANGKIEDLIARGGASPRIPIAERAVVPSRAIMLSDTADTQAPKLVGPIKPAVRPTAARASEPAPPSPQ